VWACAWIAGKQLETGWSQHCQQPEQYNQQLEVCTQPELVYTQMDP
jgi:hypothetical protein